MLGQEVTNRLHIKHLRLECLDCIELWRDMVKRYIDIMEWHLLSSVLFALCVEFVFSGAFGSCRVSSVAGVSIASVGIVLMLVFMVSPLFVHHKRKPLSLCRITLLIVVGLVDGILLLQTVSLFRYCVKNRGHREFWAEDRTVDFKGHVLDHEEIKCLLVSLVDENGMCRGGMAPLVSVFPQQCIGAIGLRSRGSVWVCLVDPETNRRLAQSAKHEMPCSGLSGECFPFVLSCPMMCGRRNRFYRVRCEVWVSLEDENGDRKLVEKLVVTNGSY